MRENIFEIRMDISRANHYCKTVRSNTPLDRWFCSAKDSCSNQQKSTSQSAVREIIRNYKHQLKYKCSHLLMLIFLRAWIPPFLSWHCPFTAAQTFSPAGEGICSFEIFKRMWYNLLTINSRIICDMTKRRTTHNKLDYRYWHNGIVSLDDRVQFVHQFFWWFSLWCHVNSGDWW